MNSLKKINKIKNYWLNSHEFRIDLDRKSRVSFNQKYSDLNLLRHEFSELNIALSHIGYNPPVNLSYTLDTRKEAKIFYDFMWHFCCQGKIRKLIGCKKVWPIGDYVTLAVKGILYKEIMEGIPDINGSRILYFLSGLEGCSMSKHAGFGDEAKMYNLAGYDIYLKNK